MHLLSINALIGEVRIQIEKHKERRQVNKFLRPSFIFVKCYLLVQIILNIKVSPH